MHNIYHLKPLEIVLLKQILKLSPKTKKFSFTFRSNTLCFLSLFSFELKSHFYFVCLFLLDLYFSLNLFQTKIFIKILILCIIRVLCCSFSFLFCCIWFTLNFLFVLNMFSFLKYYAYLKAPFL